MSLITASKANKLTKENKDRLELLTCSVNDLIMSAVDSGDYSVIVEDGNWFGSFASSDYYKVKKALKDKGFKLNRVKTSKYQMEVSWDTYKDGSE